MFFFKQKTAYEMRISDWSSDVSSSDLTAEDSGHPTRSQANARQVVDIRHVAPGVDAGYKRIGCLWVLRHERITNLPTDFECLRTDGRPQIVRASFRERVCQYV